MSPYIMPGIPDKIDASLHCICKAFSTTIEAIRTRSRLSNIVTARYLCMIYTKNTESINLVEAASRFNRDHATMVHANKTMSSRYQTDRSFRATVDEIGQNIHFNFKQYLQ